MSNTETKTAKPGLGTFGLVRFSYMNVFRPRETPEGDREYSVVLLIPKTPNEFCPDPKAVGKKANSLIQEALHKKFGEAPPKWDTPLKDGDVETNNEGEPKFPGHWFIRAKANVEYPPVLIDGYKNRVTEGWQSGDWGNVQVNFYGYEFKGKKGVSAGLRGVQFVKHDEPLGSGSDAASVVGAFEEVGGDATDVGGADPFAD